MTDAAEPGAAQAPGGWRITAFHMEKRLLRKGGDEVWVDLTVSPIWQPGEAPVYNVSVIQDITGAADAGAVRRQSERNLRDILDHLPVGVLLVQGRAHRVPQPEFRADHRLHRARRGRHAALVEARLPGRAVAPTQRAAIRDALCDAARQGDGSTARASTTSPAAMGSTAPWTSPACCLGRITW